jgi:cytochrome c2
MTAKREVIVSSGMNKSKVGVAGALVVGLVCAAVLLGQANTARAEDGKALFSSLGCTKCHAISAENVTSTRKQQPGKAGPPDLSGVGTRHPADFLKQFLKRAVANTDGKKHPAPFRESDEKLEALVTYLGTLKTAAPAGM